MTTTSLLDTFKNLGLATTSSSNSASKTTSSSSGSATTTQSLTQSDFLKLLTTQLTHQDPTNPSDSNTMVNQMAQFSTVSGIQDLLTSFQSLSSAITSDQALQASNLVGQYVSAPGTMALLNSGGKVYGDFTLTNSATNTLLTISDPTTGATVKQISLGSEAAGTVPFVWDGTDSNGAAATPGVYKVQVTAMVGGKNTQVATNLESQVGSVTLGTGSSGLQVNLTNGTSVPFSKVQKII